MSGNKIYLASGGEVDIRTYFNNDNFVPSEWHFVKLYRDDLPREFGWFMFDCLIGGFFACPLALGAISFQSPILGAVYAVASLGVANVINGGELLSNLGGVVRYSIRHRKAISEFEGRKLCKKKNLINKSCEQESELGR